VSKVKENTEQVVKKLDNGVALDDAKKYTPKEVIESIRAQHDHASQEEEKANRLAAHYRVRRTKAEGFLEVYLQLHPEEVNNEN